MYLKHHKIYDVLHTLSNGSDICVYMYTDTYKYFLYTFTYERENDKQMWQMLTIGESE